MSWLYPTSTEHDSSSLISIEDMEIFVLQINDDVDCTMNTIKVFTNYSKSLEYVIEYAIDHFIKNESMCCFTNEDNLTMIDYLNRFDSFQEKFDAINSWRMNLGSREADGYLEFNIEQFTV